MISRWNYFSITIVMVVLLLMFQMTNVMLERWNHYEENSFVRNMEELPKRSDVRTLNEAEPDSGRGMVIYVGRRDASACEVARQWAAYARLNFMCFESLEEYQVSEESLAVYPGKLVSVHSPDIDWEDAVSWKYLKESRSEDTTLVFCGLPEAGLIKKSAGLRRLFGISRVREEETTVEGLRLEPGFLLGGGVEYRTVDPEENEKRQDMDLTFPWYVLSKEAEIYMRGVPAEDSIPKGEVLELEELPAVIWRTPAKESSTYVVNGDYMEDAYGMGLLAAMWTEGKACEIYPVVNAQNLVALNYPGLALENGAEIQGIYGQNLSHLFRDRVWPVFIAAYRQNALGLTCMLAPQFDYEDENLPEQEQLLYYMKQLNEEHAEVGLSGSRVSDTPLEQKLLEDRWFMEGALPDYRFTSFYSDEVQSLQEALRDELLEPVRTVVTQYDGELEVFGYLNEDMTRQALLSDGVHYTYRQDFLTKTLETALGYASVMVDMEWIAYPDSDDALNEMSSNLGWNLNNFFKGFENFKGTTISQSDERIRTYLALDYTRRIEGNTVYLELDSPGTAAWFVLRGNGKRIRSVEGGQWTLLEDGAYLIEAAEENVVITLQDTTQW